MGFLGSWRSIIRSTKNTSKDIIDTAAVSNKLLAEARNLKLHSITPLLGSDYLKTINNTAFLGKVELNAFVNAARLCDYANSFEKAFAGTTLLSNPGVEQTLKNY